MKRMPEADLIRREIVLRNLLLPPDIRLTRASLIRWFALSLGLISPRESRNSILAVLDALFYFQYKKRFDPRAEDIVAHTKLNEKTVRYHLLALENAGIVERVKGNYRFSSPPLGEEGDVVRSLEHQVQQHTQEIFAKLREVVKLLKQ